jgi:hypothetical protein
VKNERAGRPRGRPFTANDPRANRKGRPRKSVDLLDELSKALARGDTARMAALLSRYQEQRARPQIEPDISDGDLETVTNNLRRLMPGLFAPTSGDLGKLFDLDREKALDLIPVWLARRKLGLLDADPERGWPELSP